MNHSSRNAFALPELLVAIAIIGILMAMLLQAVQAARSTARRMQCSNKVKQIGLALHQFNDVNGRLPPVHWQHPANVDQDYGQPHPKPHERDYYFSWLTGVLPYIEQGAIYEKINFQESPFINGPYNRDSRGYLNSLELPHWRCPSNPRNTMIEHEFDDGRVNRFAFTNYLAVNGTDQFTYDGVIYVNSRVSIEDVTAADGATSTLMVGERPPTWDGWYGWWFAGAGLYPWFGAADSCLGTAERIADRHGKCRPDAPTAKFRIGKNGPAEGGYDEWDEHAWHFWSFHPGGSHFLLVDGSVHFFSYSIDEELFHNLGTRNGMETIDGDF